MTNATERRCTADTKRGRCRVTRGLNDVGLCAMHSGATDPRELGRLSGKRRREPNPERVPASLREELRSLDPAIVRGAIEQALAGNNESARVSAVKLLADVDAFRQDGNAGCPKCRDLDFARRDLVLVQAGLKITLYIVEAWALAEARKRWKREEQAEEQAHEEAMELLLSAIHRAPDVIQQGFEQRVAKRVAELAEEGELVPRARVEAMAEQLAQERLLALKEEHGLVSV